ncbi:MAG: hypothetical protein WDO16_23725 [Bacteroidota bacterium]
MNVWTVSNKLFYRLKMVDQDGSFSYSQVLSLQRDNNRSITAFTVKPNPFIDKITISLTLKQKETILLEVVMYRAG